MKVLIALDDSECSDLAFDSLTERFWDQTTEFRIITVVEPMYIQAPLAGMYSEPIVAAQIEFEKYCRGRVKEKGERLQTLFPKNNISGETVLGPVAESILDEAKAWNADLVVVGSHGRKGFSRFFLGSVAERVAGHAPCSVEIIKHKLHAAAEKNAPGKEAKSKESHEKETASTEQKAVGGKV